MSNSYTEPLQCLTYPESQQPHQFRIQLRIRRKQMRPGAKPFLRASNFYFRNSYNKLNYLFFLALSK